LEDVPTKEELTAIIKALDISALQLVRKNETIWKEQYMGKSLSEEDIIKALVQNPKLIERPIVILNDNGVIGRPPEKIKALIQE
jgi:arsenate reductase